MTFYMRSGSTFNVSAKGALDITETLPVGTYTVKFDDFRGVYFLEATEGFEVPGKIYGKTLNHADRILRTFDERPNSTGVMLSGEQGSGKTMLAKILSVNAREQGIPTIVINEAHYGERFNLFMQMIEQPTVVIFDEFEKVYDREQQEKLLTLFDGVYPSKKLFIVTCNDRYRINDHMSNRPGRMYYRLNYKGLDADFIREYCEDNLENKNYVDDVVRASMMFSEFNFDVLKAVVEEMNRYGESPAEVMSVLNAKPEYGGSTTYSLRLEKDGVPLELIQKNIEVNPFTEEFTVAYMNDGERSRHQTFYPHDMVVGEKDDDGTIIMKNEAGYLLSLQKASFARSLPAWEASLAF